ncbi:MAG: biliverdin-producing heme oxygenase [bacterium]|nr:biliverdin-producing heme oxygenase [bacterium]
MRALPFFQAAIAGQLPLESYLGYLRALAVVHGALEQALADSRHAVVAAVWSDDLRKLPLLLKDVRFFELRDVADIPDAANAALAMADHIRRVSLTQPLALLAYLYVLEGAAMGAQIMHPQYARTLQLTGVDGLAYVQGAGSDAPAQWLQFQQRMAARHLGPEDCALIVQTVQVCLDELIHVFHALYPFVPDALTCLATSLNPEAGRHPVPVDPRERAAALQAARQCWDYFPYYEARYGERGWRFTKSDAAWLATLAHTGQEHVNHQIQWLSRVLATRGMPSLMLHVQLEMLAVALAAAVPEHAAAYHKLRSAGKDLRTRQETCIAAQAGRRLADAFDPAIGPDWRARLPHTGELLVAAVADDATGSTGAVESLRLWMTDAARFPAAWLAAVDDTLTQAKELAGRAPV